VSLFVIDASVAVKWVVSEAGSDEARALHAFGSFIAPELIAAECANILWKKTRRGDMTADAAMAAARTLQHVEIELRPMNALIAAATQMAIDLGHAAYDCFYLALALEEACPFVTADGALVRKVDASKAGRLIEVISLNEAAIRLARR
jgi:predicted nucleic acid-binding protein